MKFFQAGVLSLMSRPNMEDQELNLVWPLHLDISGIASPTNRLRSGEHSCQGHWGVQTSRPR
jgi:hypothetical protein